MKRTDQHESTDVKYEMNLSFQAPSVPAQEKINHRQNLDAQGPKSRLSHKNLLLKALNGEKHSSLI